MNVASTSATSQSVSGGAALARCLRLKSVGDGWSECVRGHIGNGAFLFMRAITTWPATDQQCTRADPSKAVCELAARPARTE